MDKTSPDRDSQGRFAGGNGCGAEHRFPKGISGNPGGRPAGVTFPGDHIRSLASHSPDELEQIVANDPEQSRRAAAQLLLDMTGDKPDVRRRAIAEILDRTEGKPVQRVITAEVGAGQLSANALLRRLEARLGGIELQPVGDANIEAHSA